MDSRIVSHRLHQLPIPPSTNQIKQTSNQVAPFKELLEQSIQANDQLKVSKHAERRLEERAITIDEKKWTLIQERVNEAKQKGVNDSLVIVSNAALVVSAKNNTIITAMDRNEAKSQIFTNINGTIIID